MSQTDLVQSVDRALRVLDLLTKIPESVPLRRLSQEADLPRSTTHRLLQTLIYHRLVTQDDETGEFRPGLKLFEMAQRVLRSLDIRTEALPIMEKLKAQTQLTVHLGCLDDGQVMYIEKRQADHSVVMDSAVGKRAPVHCTALGKALLAHLPAEEVRQILEAKGLARYTARTITTWEELQEELETVKANGYAVDDCEHELLIRCVAAPVYDQSGTAAAALSLTGTTDRVGPGDMRKLAPVLVQAADTVSRTIGYVGPLLSNPQGE